MNFSDIKSKELLCIEDGKNYGGVTCLYIDKVTFEAKYIGNENHILEIDAIHGVNDVIVTISTPKNIIEVAQNAYIVLKHDAFVYDCKGLKIGQDIDYPLNTSYKNQRFISVGNNTYEADKIVSSSEVVFINTGRQLPQKKSSQNNKTQTEKNKILKDPNQIIRQDYNFLIGRITKQNITDIYGTIIIKLGTIITPAIIEYAQQNGKLAELLTFSRN